MSNVTVKDEHWRSIAKAVSWRITGTLDTTIIAWLITHKLSIALAIGSIEVFTKMVLYYFHERIWERVKIGRKTIEYEI